MGRAGAGIVLLLAWLGPTVAAAQNTCVPEPSVPATSPVSGASLGRSFDRERWLSGVVAGLTEDNAEPTDTASSAAALDGDPSTQAGRRLGEQLAYGEVELTPYEWGWLSRALRTAGGLELGLPAAGEDSEPIAEEESEPTAPDSDPAAVAATPVGEARDPLSGFHPVPNGASGPAGSSGNGCTPIGDDALNQKQAQAANDALQNLLNQAARNAMNPGGRGTPSSPSGGGGGGGGGGGYAPGSADGYATPAEARRPLKDLQAEDRCVAGLSMILDAASDLAGGLGLETAEASATLGRTGSLPQSEALMQAAARKIQCGRILLGAGTYKLLGRTQEECSALQRQVRARGLDPKKIPNLAALQKLPDKWQQALLTSDPTGELTKRVIRMLDCRRSGGNCRLDLQFPAPKQEGEPDKPGKVDVAQMCGGQGNSLIARLLNDKSNDPCRIQDALDRVAQQKGLPVNLVRSVAWTESNWRQWTSSGQPIRSYSGDYGLMQLNQRAWGNKYDFGRIQNDLGYNAAAGGDVLSWSYNYARGRGFRGQALWQATYAVYNGGPGAVNRPWKRSRFSQHDRNYLRSLRNKPWQDRTQSCGI